MVSEAMAVAMLVMAVSVKQMGVAMTAMDMIVTMATGLPRLARMVEIVVVVTLSPPTSLTSTNLRVLAQPREAQHGDLVQEPPGRGAPPPSCWHVACSPANLDHSP